MVRDSKNNISKYDPSRKTVGAIYRDVAMSNTEKSVTNGDLTNVMMSSLVEDLNECIIAGLKEFDGNEFYITVHEKKDLQMPRALLRRMIKTRYRPYPEDDTIVFRIKNPHLNDIRFCWCLPHWSEMDNMLANQNLFNSDLISQIKAWKNVDNSRFGFMKDEIGNWKANPNFEDIEMKIRGPQILVA